MIRIILLLILYTATPMLSFSQQIHIVGPNETLYSIAKNYKQNLTELAQKNNISPPNYSIKIGDTIILSEPIEPITKPNHSVADSNTKYHTVQPGETVYSIVKQYPGMSRTDFYRWNQIDSNSFNIKIGQKLIVKTTEKQNHPQKEIPLKKPKNTIDSNALFSATYIINKDSLKTEPKGILKPNYDTKPNIKTPSIKPPIKLDTSSTEAPPLKIQNKVKELKYSRSKLNYEQIFENQGKNTRLYCTAKIIENNSQFSCIFAEGIEGQVVKITNTQNGKHTFAKVLAKLEKLKHEPEICIKISSPTAQAIGASGEKVFVTVQY